MATFLYVIVSQEKYEKLGIEGFRHQLSDGKYLLNEKDFCGQPGDTLWEQVTPFEGVIISAGEADKIRAGKIQPPSFSKKQRKSRKLFLRDLPKKKYFLK